MKDFSVIVYVITVKTDYNARHNVKPIEANVLVLLQARLKTGVKTKFKTSLTCVALTARRRNHVAVTQGIGPNFRLLKVSQESRIFPNDIGKAKDTLLQSFCTTCAK